MLDIETIKEILIENYGEITECGCYVNGRWFSLKDIVELFEDYVG